MSKWRLPTKEVSNREELEFYSSEKCEVCGRNVFVAVHEGDEDCNTITERLKRQGLTIGKCDPGDGKTIIHFDRCIFHVEKINEIWMQNHEEYRQWIERRKKGEETEENFTVNWNEEFVKEFWRLIRKYKDVRHDKTTNKGRWGILRGEKILNYYFALFVFPMFEQLELNEYRYDINNETFVAPYSFSFWNGGDGIKFRYQVYFTKARFLGYADFRKSQFHEYVDFANAKFFNHAIFSEVQFLNNANFREAGFLSSVYFMGDGSSGASFLKNAYFEDASFLGDTFFTIVSFEGKTVFRKARFVGKVNFDLAIFSKNADFTRAIFQKEVSFSGVKFGDETNFDGAEFKGNLNFHPAVVDGRRREATFRGKVSFRVSQFESRVNFRHVQFEKKADFQGAKFGDFVDFFDANFNEEADFGVATFGGDVNFEKAFFGKSIYFGKISEREDRQTQFRGKVNFKESKFLRAVCFKGVYFSDKVDFKDIPVVNILVLSNIDLGDNAKIVFMDVNTGGSESLCRFEISNITARLTQENFPFFNVNLSGYREIHFENVYLEDMKFVNVNWGEVNSRRYCPRLLERDPRAARDIYRQLKLALDKQENYIDAREFYALEMEARGEEIKPTFNLTNKILTIIGIFFIIGIYSYLTRSFIPEWKCLILLDGLFLSFIFYVFTEIVYKDFRSWRAFSDYIVYNFYKLTSAFGLSWVRPLMFLFGFLLIKMLLNEKDIFNFDGNLSKFTAVLDQLAYELLLLIPGANNLVEESLNKIKPENWAFLKLIYYSFVAYLIYQFVMALRRKVRR